MQKEIKKALRNGRVRELAAAAADKRFTATRPAGAAR